jgi:hydrogenase-4 component E
MKGTTDTVLVLLMLTNLALLGSSRLRACVRFTAMQGILLGALTVFSRWDDLSVRVVLLGIVSTGVKGIVFPWFLFRALRETGAQREVEPFVGYSPSLLAGVLFLGVSMWLGWRLPMPGRASGTLVLSAAFFSILTGLFLIIGRKKALMQVLGYLVMENGIYAFGIALSREMSVLIELGVLLDVLVAVFVMGIAIYHINREFDHIDADRLKTLKG